MTATMTKRILVCDSDTHVRHLVSGHFEGMGCSVTQASDLRQAADSLQYCDFDLVILDLFLAKTSGESFCRSLEDGGAKLAMVSAEDDGDHIRFGRDTGAAYYLAKPLATSDLARLTTIL